MAYLNPVAGATKQGLQSAGAPVAGTDEVQTITFGGTPTGGTFRLSFAGQTTAPITWSNVNATLVAAIDAALGALSTVGGAANVTTAVGTMTAGIGTITVTFVAALGKQAQPMITVGNNNLTGTSPTIATAETTPGVTATARSAAKGALLTDVTNGVLYINTANPPAPVWVKVGSQT